MDVMHWFSDCYIERTNDGAFKNIAQLRDEEGRTIFTVPDEWTDAQIKLALEIANRFYAAGVSVGMQRKANEVRSCLGIAA